MSLVKEATRRRWVARVCVAGAGLLGMSLSTKPGSPQFYGLTLGVAGTWIAGGLASGPLPRAGPADPAPGRQVLIPVLLGTCAFGAFYGCALLVRGIPVLNNAITKVLRYDRQGSSPWVLFTTLVNGAAEEIFFRGAVYAAAGAKQPVTRSTAVYALVTTATRNPALVLASVVMGTLFGLQRKATGGIQAPMITHLTWSTLMLRYLPPLFRHP
ncbi:MAG: lysostaphin resistance A-like protein [Pseudonocardiaceae bacterium]